MTGQIGAQERRRERNSAGVRRRMRWKKAGGKKSKHTLDGGDAHRGKDIAPDQTAIYHPLFAPSYVRILDLVSLFDLISRGGK